MWLRNPCPLDKVFWNKEFEDLQKEIKYLPNEEKFYKIAKMTRKDFQQSLAEGNDDVIMKFYNGEGMGRRGVIDTKEAVERSKKRFFHREKVIKYAEKYTD